MASTSNIERQQAETTPLRPWKEVIFRTPVIIGSTDLPSQYAAEKVRYRRGDLLHEETLPEVCRHLPNGMVIDIPVTNIEEYMM